MMKNSLLFSLILCLRFSSSSTDDSHMKLFVFGDSYADTGNWNISSVSAWNAPYGMTFPGKPAGRFSDGRILTDYIASYLNIESLIPYEQWNKLNSSEQVATKENGMNFAYGGTGVFDTDITRPNMTLQIDIFEQLVTQAKVYTNTTDFINSVALFSVGGNDYSYFLKHSSNLSVPQFTKSVISQITADLERVHSLGIRKIAVTKMEPIGCLPAVTWMSGYQNCTQSLNDVASAHNTMLQQSIDLLNTTIKDASFFTLDLYGAFINSLQPGTPGKEGLLKPCCQGITTDYECGSMEGNVSKYTVCEKPEEAFFWDQVHPAQNGWYQVYLAIKPTLQGMLSANGFGYRLGNQKKGNVKCKLMYNATYP